MELRFRNATLGDVGIIAALQNAAAGALTARFGEGHWSSLVNERGAGLAQRHARVRLGCSGKRVLTVLRLAAKKPWAIDVSYFTPVQRPLYLTGMAVSVAHQGQVSSLGTALEDDAPPMHHANILVFVFAAVAQACRSGERLPASGITFRAAVVDSVRSKAWWSDDDTMFTYLFEVRTSATADTVRNVVAPLPTIVGDTLVIGLTADERAATGRAIFVFDARRRQIQHEPLPSDAWAGQYDFSISPDGGYLLYVREMSTPGNPYGEAAVIRRRSSGEVVLTGPRWPPCECDSDLHHARWVTADSFEIATGAIGGARWERLSGSVVRRSLHTDTLPAEPKWH